MVTMGLCAHARFCLYPAPNSVSPAHCPFCVIIERRSQNVANQAGNVHVASIKHIPQDHQLDHFLVKDVALDTIGCRVVYSLTRNVGQDSVRDSSSLEEFAQIEMCVLLGRAVFISEEDVIELVASLVAKSKQLREGNGREFPGKVENEPLTNLLEFICGGATAVEDSENVTDDGLVNVLRPKCKVGKGFLVRWLSPTVLFSEHREGEFLIANVGETGNNLP